MEATIADDADISLLLWRCCTHSKWKPRLKRDGPAKGLQLDGGEPRQSWLNWGGQHDEGWGKVRCSSLYLPYGRLRPLDPDSAGGEVWFDGWRRTEVLLDGGLLVVEVVCSGLAVNGCTAPCIQAP